MSYKFLEMLSWLLVEKVLLSHDIEVKIHHNETVLAVGDDTERWQELTRRLLLEPVKTYHSNHIIAALTGLMDTEM